MKQITECLDRAFMGKEPAASKKWKAFIEDYVLSLYHYHHLVMTYDLKQYSYLYMWWEKPADHRGLSAAIKYLDKKFL